jgi:hypothetical protein
MRRPFYKVSHKAWYVHTSDKPVKLVSGGKEETEAEAMAKWAAMQGAEKPAGVTLKGLGGHSPSYRLVLLRPG